MPKRKKPPSLEAVVEARGKYLHKSKAVNPVSASWDLFDELKKQLGDKLTRKLAIETAHRKGVAFYTARTQWQEWRQAGDRDAANHERLYGPGNKYIQNPNQD